MKQSANKYYGVASRAFILEICKERDATRLWIQEAMKRFVQKNERQGSTEAVGRALGKFGLVAAAGELAAKFKTVDWNEGEAEDAAKKCFDSWLSRRGGNGAADVEAAIRQIKAYLERYGESRFQTLSFPRDNAPIVSQRAGFREVHKGQTVYYVLPETFRNDLCAGYDSRDVLKELARQGHLETNHGLMCKRRLPGYGDSPTSVYAIKSSLMSEPVVRQEQWFPGDGEEETGDESFLGSAAPGKHALKM